MPEAIPPPEASGAADPLRVTCIVGTVAAAALVVGWFLPWVHVDEQLGAAFRARVEARLRDTVRPRVASHEDWLRLAHVAEEGPVTGLEVFDWARTGYQQARAQRRASPEEAGAPEPTVSERALLLIAIVLAALPVAALAIGLYFLAHRLRRARSPVLILAMLTGMTAVLVPATYVRLGAVFGHETAPGVGLTWLLGGGAGLAFAGSFGVRARNWWRVFGGTLLTGGSLVALAWAWIRWGIAP